MKSLLLVDCHNILYRSFFAISDLYSTHQHIPTNALFGFIQSVFRIVQQTKPTHIIFALDSKEKPARTQILETYKANRPVMPDRMIIQMKEMSEKVLPAMQIPYYALPGYEADDIIATLAVNFEKKTDQILILSSDKDLWQLLADDKIKILNPAQGKSGIDVFTKADLLEKVGITPKQVVDYKAMTGDPSDNIKGIPGVGPKTAQKWLKQFDSLEKLWESDEIPSPKLIEYKELLQRNQALIKLDEKVPVDLKDFSSYAFHDWNWESLEPLLYHYQFHSLIKRFLPSNKPILRFEAKENTTSTRNQKNKSEMNMLFCWINSPLLFVCNGKEIQTFDLTVLSPDSLFSAPEWYTRLKEQLSEPGTHPLFFDLKTIAHQLFLTTEDLRKNSFNDLMLMWYLQDPNRKTYTFPEWLLSMTNQDGVDAASVMLAAEKTKQLLMVHQLENVYNALEIPLVKCLFDMENRGLCLSKKKLQEAKVSLFQKQQSLEKAIYQETGVTFNIQSPKQLGFILYEKIHLPFLKKNKTGYSTDAESLEKLIKLHPIVSLVLQYREVTKILNTYLEPMDRWIDANQLIHPRYIQAGPSTGRIACMNPNLQALPNQSEAGSLVRSLFEVRKKENIFISADYSQIDLRVLAHLSKDPVMADVFMHQGDIHDSTARSLFHISPNETPTPVMRRLAKTVQFGIIYGMSSYGLSQALGISDEEAKHYIHAYFSVYQGVKNYIDQTISEAKQKTYVQTISGRKRPIPEFQSARKNIQQLGERLAVNTTVQGSSADILKNAMIQLDQVLLHTSSSMVLTIHDEIIVETLKKDSEAISALIKEKMENAWSLSVPLLVHISTGSHLGELT